MKRISKTRLFALLFLLVAGGCTETVVEEDDIPLHAQKEVDAGLDCGLNITNFNDIQVGDVIESYEETEIKKTL